jgi:hypothetical protein
MNKVFACFVVIVVAGLGVLVYALSQIEKVPDQEVVIKDIVRLLFDENDSYTYWTQADGSNEGIKETIRLPFKTRTIFDVPAGKKMLIVFRGHKLDRTSWSISYAEIHLRGPEDINGGAWDHGKYGKGRTVVIE